MRPAGCQLPIPGLDYLNYIQKTNVINAMALLVTLATCFSLSRTGRFLGGLLFYYAHRSRVKSQPCPLIAIFVVPDPSLVRNSTQKDIIVFKSLLARRSLLLHWKSANYPSISRWLKDIMKKLNTR